MATAEAVAATGPTLLVVDDEPILLQLVERVLRKAGYRVLIAPDGEQALEAFDKSEERIRAVVIDLMLRPEGGPATLRQLLARDPELGVVVSSGSSVDADTRELLRGCRGGFVRKPFAPEALLAAVVNALESHPQPAGTLV